MPKMRKKRTGTESEVYKIEVVNWETDYHFGINKGRNQLIDGNYWEFSTLILKGTIVSPIVESVLKAVLRVSGEPRLDYHWNESSSEKSPLAIGFMQILRDNETLEFFCSVPSRSVQYITTVAAAAGKIKHASVYGEKPKWRKGKIFHFTLSAVSEED